ncbi:MAG: lysophospholipid acyltransferase family protein [Pyrinomonadaceae bacterium]
MNSLRAAIKFSLFFVSTFGHYGVWYLGRPFASDNAAWRQAIFTSWSRFFVWLSGGQIEIVGEKPEPPFFLVSNHLGYIDIPVLRSELRAVYVAKAEIESWFAAGKIVGDMGNIYIDRTNKRDIPRAGLKILETIRRGEAIIVFPEGTSTKGESVLPFNSSFFEFAAKSGLPVHFASVSYQTVDPGPKASESICWWDDTTFATHLLRLFRLKRYKAKITIGCDTVTGHDRKALARRLRDKVEECFTPIK